MKPLFPLPGETWEIPHQGKPALIVHVLTQDGVTFTALVLHVEPHFNSRERLTPGTVDTFTTDWFEQEGSLLSTERVPSLQ